VQEGAAYIVAGVTKFEGISITRVRAGGVARWDGKKISTKRGEAISKAHRRAAHRGSNNRLKITLGRRVSGV